MKMLLIEKIATLENLTLSWRKVENSLKKGEIWFDELDAFDFKLNLIQNLENMGNDMLHGKYRMQKILPAPYPKGPKTDDDGNTTLQVRQAFYVNIRDQVAWMALYNIIGPKIEKLMPAWSYGNRLGLTFWKGIVNEGGKAKTDWIHGPYRRTSPYFYMKWTHSWPLYRRRITASIKRMAHVKEEDMDESDIQTIEENDTEKDYLKLKYLEKGYFKEHGEYKKLYWLGMDLTKFYQDVNMRRIDELICKYSGEGQDEYFKKLVESLTNFEVDYSVFKDGEDEYVRGMQLDAVFTGLPTGLIVAGAIANLYLLETDRIIDKEMESNKDVIQFRYVDDHVFVSTKPIILYQWVNEYIKLIEDHNHVRVNKDKFDPKPVKEIFTEGVTQDRIEKIIEENCSLNPQYPSPLMTQSLMKVSQLGKLNMELLTKNEYNLVMTDLKEMLVTEIPEQEIKKVTRISFACSLIARLSVQSEVDYEKIHQLKRQWYDYIMGLKKKDAAKSEVHKPDKIYDEALLLLWEGELTSLTDDQRKKISDLKIEVTNVKEIDSLIKEGERRDRQKRKSILNLLYKSIEELPERDKVWMRAYQYALRYMPQELNHLFRELDWLHDNGKIHHLTFEYLDSMLATMEADSIFSILQNLEALPIQEQNDRTLNIDRLKSLVNIREKESNRYYSHTAYLMLHKAKALYNIYSQKYALEQIKDIEEYGKAVQYRNKSLDTSYWILWGLWKANHKMTHDPMSFNVLFGKFSDIPVNPTDKYAPYLFLTLLNSDVGSFDKMFSDCFANPAFTRELTSIVKPKELCYNIFELGLPIKFIDVIDNKFSQKRSKLTNSSRISIPDLINGIINIDDKEGLNVWKSEYICVKLMLAITNCIDSIYKDKAKNVGKDGNAMLFNIYDINVHPSNIFIGRKKLNDIGWHDVLSENFQFEVGIKDNKKALVPSLYYTYPSTLFKDVEFSFLRERHFVYALGLIFLQLVCKKATLPWIMNRPDCGFEWNSVLGKLLNDGKISSCNYRLIKGCLSPSSTEAYIMSNLEHLQNEDIVWRDGDIVLGIDDFKSRLMENEKLLKKNVVSLLEQHYRQIIEIDLL